jgi:dihydroflavonol-4-reductase
MQKYLERRIVDGQLVIITGVAGFLGSAVARACAARGARVRGVVRASSPQANLADFPGELVQADLRDAGAVARAFAGERAALLLNVAADYRLWARDPEEIVRNNLAMTRLVEDMVREAGLPAVIVNPSTPIGPRDVHPTPTGRILVEAASGRMPAYVDSGLNLVHVDDVAHGHLLAAEKGRVGERYILGGEDVTLARMLADIAELCGRQPPKVKLPRGPLFPLAYAAEAMARVTGREPFLTVDSLKMAGHHMYYSSARAEAELGYRAGSYRDALADALAWFRAAGMISA